MILEAILPENMEVAANLIDTIYKYHLGEVYIGHSKEYVRVLTAD
jgi:hypothetical protein